MLRNLDLNNANLGQQNGVDPLEALPTQGERLEALVCARIVQQCSLNKDNEPDDMGWKDMLLLVLHLLQRQLNMVDEHLDGIYRRHRLENNCRIRCMRRAQHCTDRQHCTDPNGKE